MTDLPGCISIRFTADIAAFGSQLYQARKLLRRAKYHYRCAGFFRMNVAGWRLVLIDTRRHRAVYSDRAHGICLGKFIVRVSRVEGGW